MLRSLAAAAIAAIVGGIGFAMWSGDPEPAQPADLSDSLARTAPKPGQPDARSLRSSATDSARATPSQDARPLVLIQPGGGFVPIERLQDSSVGKPSERLRRLENDLAIVASHDRSVEPDGRSLPALFDSDTP